MINLFIYVENTKLENIMKYGMKLSEFSNKVLKIKDGTTKNGIIAYLAPKDSEFYYDNQYTCIRVLTKDITYYIYNKLCENTNFFEDFMIAPENYTLGDFEEPMALICSCILPENIFIYNKNRDIPILIENSKEFYYEKCINHMIDSENFSNYELYQILLILGKQKKLFDMKNQDHGLQIYQDKKTGKLYTKKGNR